MMEPSDFLKDILRYYGLSIVRSSTVFITSLLETNVTIRMTLIM